jgi:hypothetical protein
VFKTKFSGKCSELGRKKQLGNLRYYTTKSFLIHKDHLSIVMKAVKSKSLRWDVRVTIQKFPDWVDDETNNNKHSLRSNTKGYGGNTHYTESQNSDATASSGGKLYHLQFRLQAASPETFGYTVIHVALWAENKRTELWSNTDWKTAVKVTRNDLRSCLMSDVNIRTYYHI